MQVGRRWKYMCDDHFDENNNGANVACRELGYANGTHTDAVTPVDKFGRVYDDVQCTGREKALADCPRRIGENCVRSEAVMLSCFPSSQRVQISPRVNMLAKNVFMCGGECPTGEEWERISFRDGFRVVNGVSCSDFYSPKLTTLGLEIGFPPDTKLPSDTVQFPLDRTPLPELTRWNSSRVEPSWDGCRHLPAQQVHLSGMAMAEALTVSELASPMPSVVPSAGVFV